LIFGITYAPITVNAAWGIVALGVLGTGLAYVWNYRNIESAGSVIASSVTYVTPVIAVILGMLIMGERLSIVQIVGGILVVISALVVQKRLRIWPGRA
jgi:drug/metabolite transporter (DMT)-like permease